MNNYPTDQFEFNDVDGDIAFNGQAVNGVFARWTAFSPLELMTNDGCELAVLDYDDGLVLTIQANGELPITFYPRGDERSAKEFAEGVVRGILIANKSYYGLD